MTSSPELKNISDELVEILFVNSLNSMETSDLRNVYFKKKEKLKTLIELEDNLRKSGVYSENRIKQILEEVENSV